MNSLLMGILAGCLLGADAPEDLPRGIATEASVSEYSVPRPAWQMEVDDPADGRAPAATAGPDDWVLRVLPDGLLYRSYAAGPKEPRFSSAYLHDSRRGWYWDSTLGGRVGVVRYGTGQATHASGWELDLEGAVFARLTPLERDDLESADFRIGVPLTWSDGTTAVKFGFYHISSHLGDEFLLKNPEYPRLNYGRDALVLGVSEQATPDLRVYGEAGWAFGVDGGARPWEFQFGAEYFRASPDERRPRPFAAINANLRQEFNFDGNVNFLTGWQWRGATSGRAFRVGLQYFRGKSAQSSFYQQRDRMLGGGLWYEY